MPRRFFFTIVCFLFCFTFFVSVQAQVYKFEGKPVVVDDTPDSGGACSLSYGGTSDISQPAITINKPSNDTDPNPVPIYSCTGTFIGNAPVSISRDSTGYFCFKGNKTAYSISFGYKSTSITYNRWLANPPDTTIPNPAPYPYSTTFYNVRDFGAKGDGVDDTAAIKNAVAYVAARQGGTIYFPPGDYAVTDAGKGITLPSGIVIRGATSLPQNAIHNYFKPEQFSRIRLKNAGRIFRIGECTTDVKLQNIVLQADSSSGTFGIEAIGKRLNGPTEFTGLNDVSFDGFDIGFKVVAIPTPVNGVDVAAWQFDYVKLDHCLFVYNRTAGIYLETFDTDWKITSSFFLLPTISLPLTKADGIKIKIGGSMLIQETFAGGASEAASGGNFIDVDYTGVMTLMNSQAEKVTNAFVYGNSPASGDYSYPITFINNVLDKVRFFGRANLVSMGNTYGSKSFIDDSTGIGTLNPGVRIYSTGDRFCYDGSTGFGCAPGTTEANFKGGILIFSSGQLADVSVPGRPTTIGTDTVIKNDGSDATKPLLTITSPNYTKPLMELGNRPNDGSNDYMYRISRSDKGWLTFRGTQDYPYRGYDFDGVVKLKSFTQTTLPALPNYGEPNDGAIVFCANCQDNTNPCQSGGTGAIAVWVSGSWKCK